MFSNRLRRGRRGKQCGFFHAGDLLKKKKDGRKEKGIQKS